MFTDVDVQYSLQTKEPRRCTRRQSHLPLLLCPVQIVARGCGSAALCGGVATGGAVMGIDWDADPALAPGEELYTTGISFPSLC